MRVHKGGFSGMVARTVECVLYFSWEPKAKGTTQHEPHVTVTAKHGISV
jgi:hypothetical protein